MYSSSFVFTCSRLRVIGPRTQFVAELNCGKDMVGSWHLTALGLHLHQLVKGRQLQHALILPTDVRMTIILVTRDLSLLYLLHLAAETVYLYTFLYYDYSWVFNKNRSCFLTDLVFRCGFSISQQVYGKSDVETTISGFRLGSEGKEDRIFKPVH